LPRIGVHVSIVGSIDKAVDRASERKLDTFQLFTRNPRQWRHKDLSEGDVSAFLEKVGRSGISPAVAHMPYLPNISSPKKVIHNRSIDSLRVELLRCGRLGIPYLVTHLGSHMGAGHDVGIRQVVKAIDIAFSNADNEVLLLLENSAGARNTMCSKFEEIQEVIDRAERYNERIGICFDTCHGFAAGYDLRNDEAVKETIDQLDTIAGIRKVKVIHANDSKGFLDSRIDRHEHIGLGKIGEEGFRALLHHELLRNLPFIMETPVNNIRDDYQNIMKLRELAK
jgi:deoxyribonuclease-4